MRFGCGKKNERQKWRISRDSFEFVRLIVCFVSFEFWSTVLKHIETIFFLLFFITFDYFALFLWLACNSILWTKNRFQSVIIAYKTTFNAQNTHRGRARIVPINTYIRWNKRTQLSPRHKFNLIQKFYSFSGSFFIPISLIC